MTRSLATAALALTVAGCAAGEGSVCRVGADCASGVCLADGTCAVGPDSGAGDAMPPGDGALPPDGGETGFCEPDHDGTIARDEILLAAGRRATFRVAVDATIDTAGMLSQQGSRAWDLDTPLAGDSDIDVALLPIDGAWFAPVFPGASYAVPLSSESDLLGVFELTGEALLLRGMVSPEGGAARTELSYDPPVTVLSLPLSTASAWSVETTLSGLTGGVPSAASESYEIAVDAVGTIATPFGEFPVLRTDTDFTRTAGGTVLTSKTYAFVAECYGIVATITSQPYELDDEFSEAAEVRRLAP